MTPERELRTPLPEHHWAWTTLPSPGKVFCIFEKSQNLKIYVKLRHEENASQNGLMAE